VDKPVNWSQDFSLFLFAWSVFLAADVALRHDKLVKMELVLLKISEKSARIITIINYLLIVSFLAALTIYGVKLSFISYRRVFQGIPGFSYTWVILCVPVGSSLMIITSILKLKNLFQSCRKGVLHSACSNPIHRISCHGHACAFAIGISGMAFFLQHPELPSHHGPLPISQTQNFAMLAVPLSSLPESDELLGITKRLMKLSSVLTVICTGGWLKSVWFFPPAWEEFPVLPSPMLQWRRGCRADMIERGYAKGYTANVISWTALITATIPPGWASSCMDCR
jgi:TRAP-type C4-dicarboxylate transport system permease small subunit